MSDWIKVGSIDGHREDYWFINLDKVSAIQVHDAAIGGGEDKVFFVFGEEGVNLRGEKARQFIDQIESLDGLSDGALGFTDLTKPY